MLKHPHSVLRTSFLLTSLVVILTTGCGKFEVKDPPADQILSIRNSGQSALSTTPDAPPLPLPVVPKSEIEKYFQKPTPPAPKTISPKKMSSKKIGPLGLGFAELADPNVDPYTSFSKLRYLITNQPYQCSAEFVGGSGDVLMTAAHCVFSNDLHVWHSSFNTYLQFDQGTYTKQFDWECVAIYSGWAQGQWPLDYAFLKLRGSSPKALGLGGSYPTQWRSVGYPSNYYGGQRLTHIDGTNGGNGGGVIPMAQNSFGKGSSGGAWLNGSIAIGLNSFTVKDMPNTMWGPAFDHQTTRLYEYVLNGCNGDQRGSSTESRSERIAKYPRDQVVIESDSAKVTYGPQITQKEGSLCSCNGGRDVFMKNDMDFPYLVEYLENQFSVSGGGGKTERKTIQLAPQKTTFLGCTQGEIGKQSCEQARTFSIESMRRIQITEDQLGIRTLQSISPQYCAEKCTSTSSLGYCFKIGTSGQALLKQLAGFLSHTINKQPMDGVVATVNELVTELGGDPDKVGNPCNRSAFYRFGDLISNEGVDCRVTSSALSNSPDALRISLVSPTQTFASPAAPLTKDASRKATANLALFKTRSNAPVLEYYGPPTSDTLNSLYGGVVVAVERNQGQLIVTTENGCAAGDE
ncbi:trypsin-like serine peptidase [Noviherbaspirillum sedimenti]|uniref:Peptidase S1 domain-containing protein n=1 Tax=Noviherbaspirillum sedimenti TaxID=2320865 RepID=A0A3A3G632_9BURK|nr:trypsin-like peptidase domain-containing protein [Noviherbaspirillum sedimenti]RJG03908.1 hypothetical protein D3878_21845 [Noviherbaspirillum sedimenti]